MLHRQQDIHIHKICNIQIYYRPLYENHGYRSLQVVQNLPYQTADNDCSVIQSKH